MPSPKLNEAEVAAQLAALPEWSQVGESIQRTYKLKDFVEAMRFVNRVSELAEVAQHHPDILIRWNLVTLTLTTHDSGGITQLDLDLARQCDGLGGTPKPGAPKQPRKK